MDDSQDTLRERVEMARLHFLAVRRSGDPVLYRTALDAYHVALNAFARSVLGPADPLRDQATRLNRS